MNQEFTHLHVHSDASRLDGLGVVNDLVSVAASKGFRHLGLTDHGTLANTISFTQACHSFGVKPILGMEAYVTRESERFHLTILADGNKGFDTLVKLNNAAQKGDDSTRPSFSLELLKSFNEGLVVLTGCPASPMQKLDWPDARSIALELKRAMPGRLYAETMFVNNQGNWVRSAKLATDIGIPPILTNDVHFHKKEQASSHTVLTKLKMNFYYNSSHLYLATRDEIIRRVQGLDSEFVGFAEVGISNSFKLAEKLQSVKFSDNPKLPDIPDSFMKLSRLTRSNLASFLGSKSVDGDQYRERLEYELEVLTSMNADSYTLILLDIIDYAKKIGVWVGPGRGSGAGSLVLFLLGITKIDPIEYGLSFDRFLNHHRKEMPDVDIDIESERREEVIDYAVERWKATPIATYSRYSHKSLTHDLCRHFRVPRTKSQIAADNGVDSDEFNEIAANNPGFSQAYDSMIGQIRHIGKHAGGVVIVDDDTLIPLERTSGGENQVAAWTEGEHRELSRVGIVKYDLLGLTSGSVLSRLEDKLNVKAEDPEDGSPVFNIFKTGNLTGIFQFSGSQGIIDFTRKVSPNTFEDLVAINALYRPGALDAGTAMNYPDYRKNPRKIHPIVDPILESTYGIICYQEQFMQIFAKITDRSMAEADLARKVIAKARPGQKEWETKYSELKSMFFKGAESHGMDTDTANKIWNEINTHTRYSFNRAHAVSYSRIAWEMAWFKYYYPVEFYAALLSVDRNSWEQVMFDIAMDDIEIVPPHVNFSTDEFLAIDGKIHLPLTVVSGLGQVGVRTIMSEAPFKSGADFLSRVPKRSCNSRIRKNLFALGAFDGITDNHNHLDINAPLKFENDHLLQEHCMSVTIPNKAILNEISEAKKLGMICGIISEVQKRESTYGVYKVYKLLPEGAVWSRDYNLEKGDLVRLSFSKNSGKITRCERIKL